MKSSLEISLFRSHNNLGGRPRCFRLIDFLIIEFRKAEISPWKQSSLSVSTSLSDPVRHPSSATVCRLREEAGHFSLRKDFILPGLPTPFMPSAFFAWRLALSSLKAGSGRGGGGVFVRRNATGKWQAISAARSWQARTVLLKARAISSCDTQGASSVGLLPGKRVWWRLHERSYVPLHSSPLLSFSSSSYSAQ